MRSYLATIARNTSKNKLRKYHSNEVLNEQIISSDLTPQDNIIKAENSQLLTELITSLGEPDSEIFFRYYYCNEKIKTISIHICSFNLFIILFSSPIPSFVVLILIIAFQSPACFFVQNFATVTPQIMRRLLPS